MRVSSIDLSALDGLDELGGGAGAGKPLLLDLDRIHEDPNQPRKIFDDVLELAASIAEVGVKVPISVRLHPVMDGHYIVKLGARRRRAALAAGLSQIPAWIDEVPSDFEQVIENLQRSDLSAMELAGFIAYKISCGMKQAEVARRLSIHRSAVTKYLALVDAPPELEAVYRSGRNQSPETLFELRSLLTRFPKPTKAWLETGVDVSRRSVEELKKALIAGVERSGSAETPSLTRKAARRADPGEIKRPVVAVRVSGRLGILVLNRRAATDDHVLVKWDDSGEVSAVPSCEVGLLRLDDARRYEPINRGLKG